MKKIFISSDHAGFKLKEDIKKHLKSLKLNFNDLGPVNDNRVDYPDYAHKLAKKVKIGKNSIIASNSFVKDDVGDFELWGGVPAHFIKKLNK